MTKTLITHNLSDSSFIFAKEKTNGLIYPSLAIINPQEHVLDNFGYVVLVGDESFLPFNNKKSEAFSVDAYTARLPTLRWNVVASKVKVIGKLYLEEIDRITKENKITNNKLKFISKEYAEYISNSKKVDMDDKDDLHLMELFLLSKNITPKYILKDDSEYNFSLSILKSFIGDDSINNEIINDKEIINNAINQYKENQLKIINEGIESNKDDNSLLDIFNDYLNEINNNLIEKKFEYSLIFLKEYLENEITFLDFQKTRSEFRKELKENNLVSDFNYFKNNIINDFEKRGLINLNIYDESLGKFTPYTKENALSIMKKNTSGGIKNSERPLDEYSTMQDIKAALSIKLDSKKSFVNYIDTIKKNEDIEKAEKEILTKLTNSIKPYISNEYYDYLMSNQIERIRLIQSITFNITDKEKFNMIMEEFGVKEKDLPYINNEFNKIKDDIQKLGTVYFEVKIKDHVQLNDFKFVLIPDNSHIKNEIIQYCKDNSIGYDEYNVKDNGMQKKLIEISDKYDISNSFNKTMKNKL